MDIKKIIILVCLSLLPFTSAEAGETSDFTLPRIQVIPITDTQSDRQYELYIKLPEGYSENKDKTYPVIYYTDAIWHIELLSGAAEFLMEEAILVGISWQKDIEENLKKEAGVHVSRYRDYSIRKSSNSEKQAKYQFGHARDHLNFVRNNVIKTIESKYRTAPGKRTYFGYSLGGEFGAYILLTQPDTFKNYILGSPSLKGEIPYLTELASDASLKRKGLNANVFISYGALEKELGAHAEKFISLLKNRNDKSLSLTHVVMEGDHQKAFPMTGVGGVTWLANLIDEKE